MFIFFLAGGEFSFNSLSFCISLLQKISFIFLHRTTLIQYLLLYKVIYFFCCTVFWGAVWGWALLCFMHMLVSMLGWGVCALAGGRLSACYNR